MIMLILKIVAVIVLSAIGIVLGLFGIWMMFSKKTLNELRDEGFYD